MNSVIDTLTRHRSERSFLDTAISDEILDAIIASAYRAPTSVNSQQVSVIVTRDSARRRQIAGIAGGQPWIAQAPVFLTFVLDMHKSEQAIAMNGETQIAHQSIESLVSGCTDIGIALASAMTAARSAGLGVVPIGGIRRSPDEMIDLLALPSLTFPVVGLALGYVDEPAHQKPRLPMETFRHEETYQKEGMPALIARYNQEIQQHWATIGRTDGDSWSESVGGYYKHIYFPNVLPAVIKQGFGTEK
ncbi:NADPH-dependent oxidoreductase [Chimaeribacter arupi]|uniref:NADPH-dependent oxidoreductase n=2 Tax=Yersiniaceae TaxID=1903411 RepID=A0A2N5EIA9_9GAMM|nr:MULTISPECIES: NADPH-dependent oxidoreductase [Yersiniaceae]MBS0969304.1 NADPH-dependent oxidoreductase [Nissabacter archeti]MDV5140345.1 NADPH-dependent oxidoreductase [Chimaeribacter arupi]PLR29268.1 NADPH-dependent oxidoreductase [Chimaeribacter arupi]PLR42346.1 NADPH-dependent oxidoreductase [Chimaeribacter arupi]PLR44370.1 NADPH-dependent oxidoreductase [Chimaeribacter arupi]